MSSLLALRRYELASGPGGKALDNRIEPFLSFFISNVNMGTRELEEMNWRR
jgi:hypothetical protein